MGRRLLERAIEALVVSGEIAAGRLQVAVARLAFGVAPVAAALVLPSSIEASGSLQITPTAAYSGALGLEVTVGSGCSFPADIDLSGTVEGTFEACRSITAANAQVVNSGATFLAGQFIEMGPDFEVVGEPFSTTIDSSLNPYSYVEDDSPDQLSTYAASFALRLDSLSLGIGDRLEHLIGYSTDGKAHFKLILTRLATDDLLILSARKDDGSYAETPSGQEIVLPSGWNEIDFSWQAAAGTGSLQVSVDGVVAGTLSGIDNDQSQVDFVRWGAVDGDVFATTGSLDLDDFASSP